jgi:hypothetical protein
MAISSVSVSITASGALNPGGPKKGSAANVGGTLNLNQDTSGAGQSRARDDAATSSVGANPEIRASADTSRKLSDAASVNNIGLNSATQVENELNAISNLNSKLNNATPQDREKIKTAIDAHLQEIDRIDTETRKAVGSSNVTVTAVFNAGQVDEQTTSVTTSAPEIGRSDLGLSSLTGAVAASDPTTAQDAIDKAITTVRSEVQRLGGNNVDLRAISTARGNAATAEENNRITDAEDATRHADAVAQKIREETAPVANDLRPEKVQGLIVESSIDSGEAQQTPEAQAAQTQQETQTRDKIAQLLGL